MLGLPLYSSKCIAIDSSCWMVTVNPLTGVPLHKDYVFMLHFWSVVAGIAATLIVSWLLGNRPKRVKTSVNSQKELLPQTDDHDRFHSDIQNLQMAPEDLEIGPMLGAGTFGEVYRGKQPFGWFGSHPLW